MDAVDATLRTIRRGPPFRVAETMQRAIEMCTSGKRSRSRQRLLAIDWEADAIRLSSWITALLLKEPPPKVVRAFYFGLFNPIEGRKGKKPQWPRDAALELYAAGFASSDTDDFCGDEGPWWPKGRYSGTRALRAMFREVHGSPGGLHEDAEELLGMSYALVVSAALASSVPPDLWLGKQSERFIAAGFDSGHILVLGRVTRRGFESDL